MRVSDSMIQRSLIMRMGQTTENIFRLQEQMSSALRINRPSDDPVNSVRAEALRASLKEVAQYKRNAQEAISLLGMTDSALGEISNLVRSARDSGLLGATGTADEAMREALAGTVENVIEAVVRVANTERAGRFLFSGYKTTTKPFDCDLTATPPVSYAGDDGVMYFEVGRSSSVAVNLTGEEVFNMSGTAVPGLPDLFSSLDLLKDSLLAGDTAQIQNSLVELDEHMARLLNMRGDIGARQQSLELTQNRLSDSALSLRSTLSMTEDADIVQVTIELQGEQNIYQATAAAAAMLGRLGLLDFLQ